MNLEVKKIWVDALRSDRFQQVKGTLHIVGEGHCCLGVLCELAIENGIDLEVSEYDERRTYDGEIGVLPKKVMDWANLEGVNPSINANKTVLAELNDEGYSFKEIADIIEKEL